tara:strand:- start:94 stop:360 length:267 start_codon:yes stop_codon:yes gene_type:complete
MAKKYDEVEITKSSRIVNHVFEGDKCKIVVEGSSLVELQGTEVKKAVYEYRNKIGASHMALNDFKPNRTELTDNGPVASGSWMLIAKL